MTVMPSNKNIHDKCNIRKCGVLYRKVHLCSKTAAFIDGIGSLLDILPEPRSRSIRAFEGGFAWPSSVDAAIAADWGAVGMDMWTAIDEYEATHKEITAGQEQLVSR